MRNAVTPSDSPRRAVVHDEDLMVFVESLPEFVGHQVSAVKRASDVGRLYHHSPDKPDIREQLQAQLLEHLRDEVIVATETATDSDAIRPDEVQEEVVKRALVGLRLEGMKRIAKDRGLKMGGKAEVLAERIARSVGWDGAEVARLVLQQDDELVEDRSYLDRFYPIAESPDLAAVAAELEFVLGRYVRVGLAEWFVFESVEADDDAVTFTGTLKAWDPSVSDSGEHLDVVPVERRKVQRQMEVRLDGDPIVRVTGGSLTEAKAAVGALLKVAAVAPLVGVKPLGKGILAGAAIEFAPETLFLLDLVTSRFHQQGLRSQNLTAARFRMERGEVLDESSEWKRPSLKAVRFDGDHILDSPAACKLIANEGRALVDVSMTMRSATSAPGIETTPFPVRVAVDRTHVILATGFGSTPSFAHKAHVTMREAVRLELMDGFAAPASVMQLAERIRTKAEAETSTDEAEILVDFEDADGESSAGADG